MKRVIHLVPIFIVAAASGQQTPPGQSKAPIHHISKSAKADPITDPYYRDDEWDRLRQAAVDQGFTEYANIQGRKPWVLYCQITPAPAKRRSWFARTFHPVDRSMDKRYPAIHCSGYPPVNPHIIELPAPTGVTR